jgi:hypothetical protein
MEMILYVISASSFLLYTHIIRCKIGSRNSAEPAVFPGLMLKLLASSIGIWKLANMAKLASRNFRNSSFHQCFTTPPRGMVREKVKAIDLRIGKGYL